MERVGCGGFGDSLGMLTSRIVDLMQFIRSTIEGQPSEGGSQGFFQNLGFADC
jgi:hypothetical protein